MPLNPSITPNLSAPSLSLTQAAVVLPALSNPSVAVNAVQNPLPLPSALVHTALPAPSKSDDVRREAAKAVADWRAAKASASGSAATPATPESSSQNLDALFDGALPTSARVLGRAADLDLSPAALGLALVESKSVTEASARLQALGVLGPREAALATNDEDGFRFLLVRLWKAAAPQVPSAITVDKSWSVPALKVVRDGKTYLVHGVTHGQLGAPARGSVLRLARAVAKKGDALYSEQNLPAYYGFTTGRETLDHASEKGALPAIVPAAQGRTVASLRLSRVLNWLVSPGSAYAALAWVILSPASLWAWAALAALAPLAWLVLTGSLPLMRRRHRRRAAEARAAGLTDMADQYADEARFFFTRKPDLETLRGLELPQPLGGKADDAYSARSRAIADAVAADSAAGPSTVHVVVGHLHAQEVAWRLAEGPRTSDSGSHVS